MELKIGTGTINDCEQILCVIHTSFAKYRGKLNPESGSFAETIASLKSELTEYSLVVAEINEKIIGCVLFTKRKRDVYFYRLAVLSEFQSKGIARRLIATIEEVAILEGYDRVTLEVKIVLTENIQFFNSRGTQ